MVYRNGNYAAFYVLLNATKVRSAHTPKDFCYYNICRLGKERASFLSMIHMIRHTAFVTAIGSNIKPFENVLEIQRISYFSWSSNTINSKALRRRNWLWNKLSKGTACYVIHLSTTPRKAFWQMLDETVGKIFGTICLFRDSIDRFRLLTSQLIGRNWNGFE